MYPFGRGPLISTCFSTMLILCSMIRRKNVNVATIKIATRSPTMTPRINSMIYADLISSAFAGAGGVSTDGADSGAGVGAGASDCALSAGVFSGAGAFAG